VLTKAVLAVVQSPFVLTFTVRWTLLPASGAGVRARRSCPARRTSPTLSVTIAVTAVHGLTTHGVPRVRHHGDDRVRQSARSRRHVQL